MEQESSNLIKVISDRFGDNKLCLYIDKWVYSRYKRRIFGEPKLKEQFTYKYEDILKVEMYSSTLNFATNYTVCITLKKLNAKGKNLIVNIPVNSYLDGPEKMREFANSLETMRMIKLEENSD